MKYILTILLSFLIVSCSTINQSANSAGISTIQLEPNVEVGGKIKGSSNALVLFGLFELPGGSNKYIDGVSVGGGSGGISLGPIQLPNPFDKSGKLKSAALYQAMHSSGADLIVNPQYVITVHNMILFKNYKVDVSGYKGTINGFK